jgi:hypothetical protein
MTEGLKSERPSAGVETVGTIAVASPEGLCTPWSTRAGGEEGVGAAASVPLPAASPGPAVQPGNPSEVYMSIILGLSKVVLTAESSERKEDRVQKGSKTFAERLTGPVQVPAMAGQRSRQGRQTNVHGMPNMDRC